MSIELNKMYTASTFADVLGSALIKLSGETVGEEQDDTVMSDSDEDENYDFLSKELAVDNRTENRVVEKPLNKSDICWEKINEFFGAIKERRCIYYWKYEFTIELTTEKGFKVEVVYGGNSEDIYKYDFRGQGLDEDLNAVTVTEAPEQYRTQDNKLKLC